MPHCTLTIGNVEISVLHDAKIPMRFNQAFPGVPPEAWAPYQELYPEAYIGSSSFRVHFECYLIRSQGQTLLVDTGLGNASSNPGVVANIGVGMEGVLLAELQAAGFQPSDIDTVFLTHLHPDHVGWNMTRDGDGEWASRPPSPTPATSPMKPIGLHSAHPETRRSLATTGGPIR